jgi:hypothetical protein
MSLLGCIYIFHSIESTSVFDLLGRYSCLKEERRDFDFEARNNLKIIERNLTGVLCAL